MKNYSFTCSCGEKMTVQADSKEAAVEMMMQKGMSHMMEKHPEDKDKMTPDQSKEMMMNSIVEEM